MTITVCECECILRSGVPPPASETGDGESDAAPVRSPAPGWRQRLARVWGGAASSARSRRARRRALREAFGRYDAIIVGSSIEADRHRSDAMEVLDLLGQACGDDGDDNNNNHEQQQGGDIARRERRRGGPLLAFFSLSGLMAQAQNTNAGAQGRADALAANERWVRDTLAKTHLASRIDSTLILAGAIQWSKYSPLISIGMRYVLRNVHPSTPNAVRVDPRNGTETPLGNDAGSGAWDRSCDYWYTKWSDVDAWCDNVVAARML